jgi:hypothetical protein
MGDMELYNPETLGTGTMDEYLVNLFRHDRALERKGDSLELQPVPVDGPTGFVEPSLIKSGFLDPVGEYMCE